VLLLVLSLVPPSKRCSEKRADKFNQIRNYLERAHQPNSKFKFEISVSGDKFKFRGMSLRKQAKGIHDMDALWYGMRNGRPCSRLPIIGLLHGG
jgi:hypothetical protein